MLYSETNPSVKKESKYGPGGRHCMCCGPAPCARKKHDRICKRREKRIAMNRAIKETEQEERDQTLSREQMGNYDNI